MTRAQAQVLHHVADGAADAVSTAAADAGSVGDLLRAWRSKRRLSQMELALTAGVSARHLSYVETGRAKPSATLLDALADVLRMPLRERNALLLAGGFAPRYSQTRLDAPTMQAMRASITRLLDAHDPFPGLALDRHWNVVIANRAAQRMIGLVSRELREGVPNVFRLSLHPQGMAAHTANFQAWGRYLLRELQRLVDEGTDRELSALYEEVRAYPNVKALLSQNAAAASPADTELLIPCILRHGGQLMSLFTTLVSFGSARDVTLAELTVELFYPSDPASDAMLRALDNTAASS